MMRNSGSSGFGSTIINNITSIITIITAIATVILNIFGLISSEVIQSIIIALLALIAVDNLIANWKRLSNIKNSIDDLSKQINSIEINKFDNVDEAVLYIAMKTKQVKKYVDQASIDKQRARKTNYRIIFEQTREELILADRVTYRYIGIADIKRRFDSIKKLMEMKELNKLFTAFLIRSADDIPLMSFTIFDREEVVIRVPYEFGEEAEYLAIKNKDIANLFLGYFDKMWGRCKKVKDIDELQQILDNLKI